MALGPTVTLAIEHPGVPKGSALVKVGTRYIAKDGSFWADADHVERNPGVFLVGTVPLAAIPDPFTIYAVNGDGTVTPVQTDSTLPPKGPLPINVFSKQGAAYAVAAQFMAILKAAGK